LLLRRRRFSGLAGPLILFAIIVGMYWKLVLTRQYTWLNSPDATNLILPWFQLQASALHHGALALWDPYEWCGQPLIGQGQAGVAYPLNWILWAMPLHHTWLRHVYLNWYFILIHFQAALFTYFLCRDLKLSVPASLFGGLAFGVGPFMGSSEWPAALNAAVWAPLQLMFFFRSRRGEKPLLSTAACGAALGASWQSGSDEVPLLLTLALAALWIWNRHWKLTLTAAATAAGVSAFQALPTLQYLSLQPAVWSHPSLDTWIQNSLQPLYVSALVIPGAGDPQLFAGWTTLTLALIGLWTKFESDVARVCAAIALAGFLIPFGRFVSLSGVLYGLGGLAKDPRHALVLFGLGIAVLSAIGLDSLPDFTPRHFPATLAIVGAFCFVVVFVLSLTQGDDIHKFTPLALCGIAALLLALLLRLRAPAVCAILLAMWELGHVAGMNWVSIESGWPLLTRLSSLPAGDFSGTDRFDGPTGGTQNIVRVADLPAARALTAQRAWVVNEVDRVDGDQAVRARLSQPTPRAFVSGADPQKFQLCHDTGNAIMTSRSQIEATLPCPGLVVIRQTFYPGWSAWVDGRRAPLFEAYGFLDAVPVAAGRHVIQLKYRPLTVWIGAFLTFATLAVVLFALPRYAED